MEIYYEPDERIIATTIPSFDRNKKISQTQIRVKAGGEVISRKFQRRGLEFNQIAECSNQIASDAVILLIRQVTALMKMSDSMPVIDDSGSREIALHHEDGSYESIQFPDDGGRKHPARRAFDEAWRVIEASATTNSEQVGTSNGG